MRLAKAILAKGFILLTALLLAGNRRPPDEQINSYTLTQVEKQQLEEGDFILRRGHGLVSNWIVHYLDQTYDVSHIGVLVREDKRWQVISALSSAVADFDGMQKASLDAFTDQSHRNKLMVSRLGAPKNIRSQIANQANKYLEQKTPFDHHFDHSDPSAFYCTELPWHIIQDLEADVSFKKGQLKDRIYLLFSTFWDPNHFKVVLNHFKRGEARSTATSSVAF